MRTPKPKFPTSIRQAMTAAGYRKAKPEIKLAFMIGYLCGGLTDAGMMRRGPKAHYRWAKAREGEIDRMCQEFDEQMLREFVGRIESIKAINN
jgi:hypothetical protein